MSDSVDDRRGEAAAMQGPVVIEVDLFSGRENPVFTLDAEVADEVADVLWAMEVSGGPRTADLRDGRLGFRHFVVDLAAGEESQTYWVSEQGSYQVDEAADEPGELTLLPLEGNREDPYRLLRAAASRELDADLVDALPSPAG